MFNVISIVIAVIAVPVILIGLIPFFGILQYIAIFLTLVGIVLGSFGESKTGRTLNIILLVISGVRLWMGGGLL